MISLRRLSIPKKIVAISMIITASTLLLASSGLVAYDFIAARKALTESTTTLARIVADNTTAAVSFNDQAAAMETLSALRAEPSVVAACIYTQPGLFAQYLRTSEVVECQPYPSTEADDEYLLISTAIELKGKQIGTVQLRTTLQPVYAHLRLEIATIAGIMLLLALFALGLSSRLQKLVSQPILNLSRTANAISRHKDYSIRATKQTDDELGTLVDSFNGMVMKIQERETDLEERTVALANANEELQRANKMKDEFLATLSHELRTPLTAIFGWVNILKSGNVDPDTSKKAIDVIDRNLRAQLQIVDDLLNVSRIVTGQLRVRPEWVDCGATIRAAVESILPAATAKGINVVTETPERSLLVFADPERLQQILWNLLTNAIKFTGRGGEVRIKCDQVANDVRLIVSDTGDGIDAEFIPFLFERFTQADSSKTRKHGGLGLGLAIVRHIVESHGGTVAAKSDGKGRGSTFIVQLPTPAAAIRAVPESGTPAASLRGLKVMVVEDELDTREMLAESLEQFGAHVLLAGSGREALRVLSGQRPDVLVSDIGMPEMDGYELMKKIRSDPSKPNDLPAIALTAFASDDDKRNSFNAGYQAHLVKPVTMNELVSTIAFVAGKSKTA